MEKKYKILGEFIKNISAETKDVESYIYTKENISKFKLLIDINTRPLKNKMAEVLISTKFKETDEDKQKSYFEMIYAVIVKIDEDVNTKEILDNASKLIEDPGNFSLAMSSVSITLSLDIVGLPINLSSLLMCEISNSALCITSFLFCINFRKSSTTSKNFFLSARNSSV